MWRGGDASVLSMYIILNEFSIIFIIFDLTLKNVGLVYYNFNPAEEWLNTVVFATFRAAVVYSD